MNDLVEIVRRVLVGPNWPGLDPLYKEEDATEVVEIIKPEIEKPLLDEIDRFNREYDRLWVKYVNARYNGEDLEAKDD